MCATPHETAGRRLRRTHKTTIFIRLSLCGPQRIQSRAPMSARSEKRSWGAITIPSQSSHHLTGSDALSAACRRKLGDRVTIASRSLNRGSASRSANFFLMGTTSAHMTHPLHVCPTPRRHHSGRDLGRISLFLEGDVLISHYCAGGSRDENKHHVIVRLLPKRLVNRVVKRCRICCRRQAVIG